jgi:hypothetical protein
MRGYSCGSGNRADCIKSASGAGWWLLCVTICVTENRVRAALSRLAGQLDLRDPRNSDARLSVAYALELLSGYAHESSVEGEREAEQRRLEAERQAEERQERMRQIRASAVQPR